LPYLLIISKQSVHGFGTVNNRRMGRCESYSHLLNLTVSCVISGFRRRVNEAFALLGCYSALPTCRDKLLGSFSRFKFDFWGWHW